MTVTRSDLTAGELFNLTSPVLDTKETRAALSRLRSLGIIKYRVDSESNIKAIRYNVTLTQRATYALAHIRAKP